jgi:hypothetical protein
MLPYLQSKKKSGAAMAVVVRKPDENQSVESPAKDNSDLEVAMQDIMEAHERKDYKGMARAFRAAFEILESQPHDESESYGESETE